MVFIGGRRALLAIPDDLNPPPGASLATWNPSDKDADIALSGGNLTAQDTGATHTNPGVRATVGKSSGKWYWEMTVGGTFVTGCGIGFGSATQQLIGGASLAALEGLRVYHTNGNGFKPSTAYGASYTVGDVIGVALDMDNGQVTFYKNGAAQGTFTTGLVGTFYPQAYFFDTSITVVAKFGGTGFAFAAPAGYHRGLWA